jgi:hypothetical protein
VALIILKEIIGIEFSKLKDKKEKGEEKCIMI